MFTQPKRPGFIRIGKGGFFFLLLDYHDTDYFHTQ